MLIARLTYLLRRTGLNLWQNPFLAATTISVATVALTVVGVYLLLVGNLQSLTKYWGREIQAIVYLQTPPGDDQLHRWQQTLQRLPMVQTVRYVSPEEAYRRFEQRLGSDADLLTGVPTNLLPASLEISLRETYRNQAGISELLKFLRGYPEFAEVDAGQEWLERFESALLVMRLIALILGGFLLFAALVIIANTIRLTFYARRSEIEIQELVGAAPLVILAPFLLEGLLQGLFGGAGALLTCHLGFNALQRYGSGEIAHIFGLGQLTFLTANQQLLLVAAGGLLGLLGSLLASFRLVRE